MRRTSLNLRRISRTIFVDKINIRSSVDVERIKRRAMNERMHFAQC